MSKTQSFVTVLACLAAGVALVIVGGLTGNEAMIASATGLLGVAIGAIGIKRPQDID